MTVPLAVVFWISRTYTKFNGFMFLNVLEIYSFISWRTVEPNPARRAPKTSVCHSLLVAGDRYSMCVCVYDVCHSLLVAGDRYSVCTVTLVYDMCVCVCVCVCLCMYVCMTSATRF